MLPHHLIPSPDSVLFVMGAFLVCWAGTLVYRGLRPTTVGARRCPGCDARMAAGALACPCGFVAASERELRRRRRDWRYLSAGLTFIAVGVGVFISGAVVQSTIYETRSPWGGRAGGAFSPWTGAALGVAAFGVVLAIWAWRGDRPRGRKRCPTCWYDMSGATSLKCTECGHEARSAGDLFRPRRRRSAALFGLALLPVAYGVLITPRVLAGGWPGAIPTWALILGVHWWPDEAITRHGPFGPTEWSLAWRQREGRLNRLDRTLLRWKLSDSRPPTLARAVRQFEVALELDHGIPPAALGTLALNALLDDPSQRPALARLQPAMLVDFEADAARVEQRLPELIALLSDPAPNVPHAAAWALASVAGRKPDAMAAIVAFARANPTDQFLPFLLGQAARNSPEVRATLLEIVRDAPNAPPAAVWALARVDDNWTAEEAEALLDVIRRGQPQSVRWAWRLMWTPTYHDASAHAAIDRVKAGLGPEGLDNLVQSPRGAPAIIDDLITLLTSADARIRRAAIHVVNNAMEDPRQEPWASRLPALRAALEAAGAPDLAPTKDAATAQALTNALARVNEALAARAAPPPTSPPPQEP